jgi:hypothetical protein
MPLPNPQIAKEILAQVEQEKLLQEKIDKEKKRKHTLLKKQATEKTNNLLLDALNIAYEGRSFFRIYLDKDDSLQNLIEENLIDLGFQVFNVEDGIKNTQKKIQSITETDLHPVLNEYNNEIFKLKKSINSWLSVRYNRLGTYQEISDKFLPLVINQIIITESQNNWVKIMATLDSWYGIAKYLEEYPKESGSYALSSLVIDDEDYYEASWLVDIVLNSTREKVIIAHAIKLKNLAIQLKNIQELTYGNLQNMLELLKTYAPSTQLLSWSNSPKKVIKHGELTSWVLSWISQGEGKNFLDDFSSQLEAHASEGLKQFDFGKEIFQLQKAGLNNEDLLKILKTLNFEVEHNEHGLTVRWA